MRVTTFFVLVWLAGLVPAGADTIQLRSGDRYSGTVVRLETGTLTFKTPHGELRIPWTDVTTLTTDTPLLVTASGGPESDTVVLVSDADGTVALDPGRVVALSEISALRRPRPPLTINGSANTGFLAASGNSDVNSLRVDGEVILRTPSNRYTLGGAINRAADTGRETARNATGSVRYDRFLSERLFVNGHTILTHDRFRDLDLRTALGAGLGYQVYDGRRIRLSVDAGFGFVTEDYRAVTVNRYGAVRESTKLDVYVAGRRIVVFHSHDGYVGVTGDDNLFVKTQTGVRLGLVGGLVTTMQFDLDYDRSPAAGRLHTDRALAVTFGYRF